MAKQDCIFCKIVKGKIPCHKIYEDDDFLTFLDINPLNPGHSLLIPKKHHRWVDDVPNFGAYFEVAKKVSLSIKKKLKPLAVYYLTMGFQIPHAHVHVIPRFEKDGHTEGINLKAIKKINEEEMKEIAEKIRKGIS